MIADFLLLYYFATKTLNNSDPFMLDFSVVGIYSHKNKHTTRNQRSLTIAVKSSPSYYAGTNKPNNSDSLISISLIENKRSHKNKRTNTKNDNNMKEKILLYICTIKR